MVGQVAVELAAALDSDREDTGLGSSTDRRESGAPKAKSGGKGRDGYSGKEPAHEDEADGHVREVFLD